MRMVHYGIKNKAYFLIITWYLSLREIDNYRSIRSWLYAQVGQRKDKKGTGEMHFGSLLFRMLAVLSLPMPRVLPSLEYNRVS